MLIIYVTWMYNNLQHEKFLDCTVTRVITITEFVILCDISYQDGCRHQYLCRVILKKIWLNIRGTYCLCYLH